MTKTLHTIIILFFSILTCYSQTRIKVTTISLADTCRSNTTTTYINGNIQMYSNTFCINQYGLIPSCYECSEPIDHDRYESIIYKCKSGSSSIIVNIFNNMIELKHLETNKYYYYYYDIDINKMQIFPDTEPVRDSTKVSGEG